MIPPRPTELAHTLLKPLIQPGDVAIDATAGNGHDTLFLATCVGESGRVLAFDVQESAILATRRALDAAGLDARVECHLENHVRMAEHAAAGTVRAVMFNLGYLPGGDHDLTTQTPETLQALSTAARLVKSGGALAAVCYPGHPAGAGEAAAVEDWMKSLARDGWKIARYGMLGSSRPAPFLLLGIKG